jgi:hypothetical protein
MKRLWVIMASALLVLGACADPAEVDDDLNTAANNGSNTNNGAVNNGTNNGAVNNGANNGANNGGPVNNGTNNGGPVNNGGRNNDRPEVDMTPDPSCAATWAVFFEGFVVDEQGRPVQGAKAQMCVRNPADRLLCLNPVDTEADGFFSIIVPENARCVAEATMRSLKPGADVSTFYCHVEAEDAVVLLDSPAVLFPTQRPAALPPEGDINQERTVTFSDGLELDVTPFDFFGTYGDLAAARIDPAELCFLEGQDTPRGVYAFSPEGDIDGEGFPVRIPNSDGLAPGTAVDLFVLGGLSCTLANGQSVAESEWAKFGTARVSGDGAMIVSDPGVGVPCLGWLGWR